MNNLIRVLEDKDFVCVFVILLDSLYEVIEIYCNYLDLVEEIEFEYVFFYLLCFILVEGVIDVIINDEVWMCIEYFVNEKNIIRKNNVGKKV